MVVIPPLLAYGSQGIGPIKPNSWLVFEMELVSFVEG
jgi:FKBP-type peptidyl-prolyl cis-trans isomerase